MSKKTENKKFIKPKKDEISTNEDIINFFETNMKIGCEAVESKENYLNFQIPNNDDFEVYTVQRIIRIEELVDEALRYMGKDKSTGPGGIPIEIYKNNPILKVKLKQFRFMKCFQRNVRMEIH